MKLRGEITIVSQGGETSQRADLELTGIARVAEPPNDRR